MTRAQAVRAARIQATRVARAQAMRVARAQGPGRSRSQIADEARIQAENEAMRQTGHDAGTHVADGSNIQAAEGARISADGGRTHTIEETIIQTQTGRGAGAGTHASSNVGQHGADTTRGHGGAGTITQTIETHTQNNGMASSSDARFALVPMNLDRTEGMGTDRRPVLAIVPIQNNAQPADFINFARTIPRCMYDYLYFVWELG